MYHEILIIRLSRIKEIIQEDIILNKINKYEAENTFFEKKCGCKYEEFKHKVESMEKEKNFEWEDDLMDWEFAFENVKYWQKSQ